MVGYWLKLAHAPTLLYSWPVEVPYPRVPLHVRLRSRLVFFVDPRPSGCEGCVWPPAEGGGGLPSSPGSTRGASASSCRSYSSLLVPAIEKRESRLV